MSTLFRVDMQTIPTHGHAKQRGHATQLLSPQTRQDLGQTVADGVFLGVECPR
jgi:hypothetical protein